MQQLSAFSAKAYDSFLTIIWHLSILNGGFRPNYVTKELNLY